MAHVRQSKPDYGLGFQVKVLDPFYDDPFSREAVHGQVWDTLIHTIHQPSEWDQIVVFNCLDLYHKSPDSGELQYKSNA